jgi:hypothetical protein
MDAIADQLHSLKIVPATYEVKIVVNRIYSTSAKRYREDPEYREAVKTASRARTKKLTPEQ